MHKVKGDESKEPQKYQGGHWNFLWMSEGTQTLFHF